MWERRKLSLCAAAAVLAGCTALPNVAPGAMPRGALSLQRDAALTVPHVVKGAVHSDHSQSFMSPDKGKKSALLYVGDWSTNDVYVYDYPSGKSVGTLTGFDEPYGMCIDIKGDVFVANFGAGDAVEYKHGGTSILKTYKTGGEPIGCSISAKGDVAVTNFNPGGVTVFAGGNPSDGITYNDTDCEYQWTMGYDAKGNLVGVGEYSSISVCALLAGSRADVCALSGSKCLTTLTTSGITVDFPGGTTWDGKHIALGDQEAGGTYQTGVWPSTISGTTIAAAGSEAAFSDSCYSDYTDDVNPFFTSDKGENITPKSKKRATKMVGPNLWCVDAGSGAVDYWPYPNGASPVKLSAPPSEPYGAAVSGAI